MRLLFMSQRLTEKYSDLKKILSSKCLFDPLLHAQCTYCISMFCPSPQVKNSKS